MAAHLPLQRPWPCPRPAGAPRPGGRQRHPGGGRKSRPHLHPAAHPVEEAFGARSLALRRDDIRLSAARFEFDRPGAAPRQSHRPEDRHQPSRGRARQARQPRFRRHVGSVERAGPAGGEVRHRHDDGADRRRGRQALGDRAQARRHRRQGARHRDGGCRPLRDRSDRRRGAAGYRHRGNRRRPGREVRAEESSTASATARTGSSTKSRSRRSRSRRRSPRASRSSRGSTSRRNASPRTGA